jgi:putative transposase
MKFIAIKTSNGDITGKIALYCRVLKVSRQGFYYYLENIDKPWKYKALAAKMNEIIAEDECNDTYGRHRMHDALKLKKDIEGGNFPHIPHERTVYRIMEKLGMVHTPKRKPNGITKADKEAMKADDKIKRDFTAQEPLIKAVTDITEIKTVEGKLYVSAIEDCFDNAILGLSIANNMKAELCVDTLKSAIIAFPGLRGAIVHSDRGSQYTSNEYRMAIKKYEIIQSMNSAGGRCHDNAKCESLWGRFKEELLYGRYNTEKMSNADVKSLIWRYFMSYWNNRRISSANGGLPPMVKRKKYYEKIELKAG